MAKKHVLRSPFAKALRTMRLQQGLSQANLVDRISHRARRESTLAELGTISAKTVSNLEAPVADPAGFVRPRAHTVRLLATALDLIPGSPEEAAFFAAAEETRQRDSSDPEAAATFVRAGREQHITALHRAWQLAVEGTPQIVFVTGDAGSGKTSLVLDLIATARQEHPALKVAWGECTSGASSVEPYLPFRQGISRMIRADGPVRDVVESDTAPWPAVALQHLVDTAFKLGGVLIEDNALRHRISDGSLAQQAEIERILDARTPTDTLGRFDEFARLLAALSASWPIIIVLEDLHWSGPSSTALLLHLQRQLASVGKAPILVVGTYRPADLTTPDGSRHPLKPVVNEITRLSGTPVIDLSTAMRPTSGRAFIIEMLKRFGLPDPPRDELADLLERRTSGHPLFVIELLRWLHESGSLAERDGAWQFEPPASVTVVPARIRSVIAERIERLPRREQGVLEMASIQGSTIAVEVLARVSGLPPNDLEMILDNELVDRHHLLREGAVIPFAGTRIHTYDFTHALFQEYVYDDLSPARRERLHRQTAEEVIALIPRAPELVPGELSYHYARAHMPAEAARYAMQSATSALKRLNYDLAGVWLDRTASYALEAGDLELVCGANAGKVAVFRGTGDLDTAVEVAHEALRDCIEHGFAQIEAQCHDLIAHIHFDRSQLDNAIEHLGLAVTLHRQAGELASASGSEAMLSHCWYRLGAYDEALRHARHSWRNARDAGHDGFAAEALLAAGNCEVDLGHYQAAIETYERATPIYARTGEVRGQILTALNIGLCLIQLNQCAAALTTLHAAETRFATARTPRLVAVLHLYTGLAHECAGNLDAAAEHFAASLAIRVDLGHRNDISDNLASLLRLAIATNDNAGMRRLRADLMDWLDQHGMVGMEDPALVILSLADAHHALSDEEARNDILRQGINLLNKRAANITDENARRSYLEAVPSNRRLRDQFNRFTTTGA